MSVRTSRAVAIGSLGVFLAVSSPALALPSARLVYLRGRGTDSCPSEAEVRQAVQQRLGYDSFASNAASTMFVEVTAVTGGYTAQLKLIDGENVVRGDRALHLRGRCAELMEAMALTISIAIDPMSVTRSGPPEDAPPAEKPVETAPTTLSPDPESTARDAHLPTVGSGARD
jgi:hypothetical protein